MDRSDSLSDFGVENPYAAPAQGLIINDRLPADVNTAEAEEVRRAHLNHETSVKAVGGLMIFFGVVLALLAISSMFGGSRGTNRWTGEERDVANSVGFLILSLFHFAVGIGLRRLLGWARWTGLVFALLYVLVGVIQVNIFGLVFGFAVYLLLSRKSGVVFSPRYREIVAQTPHIRYRMSRAFTILLGLVLGFVALAIAIAIAGSLNS